jgi:hypothetical protein
MAEDEARKHEEEADCGAADRSWVKVVDDKPNFDMRQKDCRCG